MKKIFLGAFIASAYLPIALADTCEAPKLTGREGYSTVFCLNEEGLSSIMMPMIFLKDWQQYVKP